MNEKFIDEKLENNNHINQLNISAKNSLELIPEVKEGNRKCCCLRCCCCCCCCCCCSNQSEISQKNLFISKLQEYLKLNEKEDTDLPFLILTNLYASNTSIDKVIDQLHQIRLNPNYLIKFRTDLEFYIPQLCTYLLFGGKNEIEEFFVFLCQACELSHFFGHRIHWFLAAMINPLVEKENKVKDNLIMINTLYKSENKTQKMILSNFYIEQGNEYLKLIQENQLDFLYINSVKNKNLDNINQNELNFTQKQFYETFNNSRKIIEKYSDIEYRKVKNKNEEELNLTLEEKNIMNYKLKPNEFFIDISNFKLQTKDISFDKEENDDLEEEKNEETGFNVLGQSYDINFISYHSSINFINYLCDISNELAKISEDQQMNFLYEKINEINKKLPCNVYLPFMSEKCRNYFIVHIPLKEMKIFRTKTRAPIMLTFELALLKDVIEAAKADGQIINDIHQSRAQSFGGQSNYNININKNKNKNKNKKTINLESEDEDIKLSKPVKVGNKENPLKKSTEYLLYSDNVNEDMSFENENKFNKIRKKFRKKNNIGYRNQNTVFDPIVQPKIMNLKLEETLTESKLIAKNEEISNEINTNKNNNSENNNENNVPGKVINSSILNINNDENPTPIKKCFGELYEMKKKTIKIKSIFGKLKSHKIFRCIIKTNEDLRQEQFATQLINEFYQIFQITKSHCWLNTYEIISTGNNSGLVEMVNDSLSLDQLKQKTNGISLNDFYKMYFNGPNSKLYEIAMENLCQSLAGYSLVCYFLQIKDRHNGNILIDVNGHIIHIDFGFLLSNAPGKGLKFENAPFKLTNDFVDCLGGTEGKYFKKFTQYLYEGFYNIHKHRNKIIILVEMMWCGHGTGLPCFENQDQTISDLKERLSPPNCKKDSNGNIEEKDCFNLVNELISQSVDNWRTKCYDWFQYKFQGIFY